MTTPAIEANGLVAQFGNFRANDEVSMSIQPGERRALIGPNGAGKSTLFNMMAGQLRPTSGTVHLFGKDITRLPAHRRARRGVARTFQITNLLAELTVRQNVELTLAAESSARRVFWRSLDRVEQLSDRAEETLGNWDMLDFADWPVSRMAYGQQRVLEIVLAMCREPKILLLDEPTAGLAPVDAARLTTLVGSLPRSVTIVFIEHDMEVAFGLADTVTVLQQGRVLAEGPPAAIAADENVLEAYLGEVQDA
ncbi:MAG: ABC transporter ATP-binding protein [Actinomycetota bacterium]|nr:ABC transporter ATP-binding protein [Actinomycetota bacterium]